MTRIEVLQTFSDGGQHYIAGEVRMVSAAKAEYFCGAGWCRSAEYEAGEAPRQVTLEVHNGRHVHIGKIGVSNG